MAEYTATTVQTVAVNQNVLFTDTPICGPKCVVHRDGSGIITLRGITKNQEKARFQVVFGGNISIPTGGTVGEISIAISINGESIQSSVATVTPAAVNESFNVSSFAIIDVPAGCCNSISIQNVSTIPIQVSNANMLVTRIA